MTAATFFCLQVEVKQTKLVEMLDKKAADAAREKVLQGVSVEVAKMREGLLEDMKGLMRGGIMSGVVRGARAPLPPSRVTSEVEGSASNPASGGPAGVLPPMPRPS
jgi:hypothetical protein